MARELREGSDTIQYSLSAMRFARAFRGLSPDTVPGYLSRIPFQHHEFTRSVVEHFRGLSLITAEQVNTFDCVPRTSDSILDIKLIIMYRLAM